MADDEQDMRPVPPLDAYEQELPDNVVRIDAPRSPTTERGRRVGRLTLYLDPDVGTGAPRDYFLKGLLSPGEMSTFYGPPGCGKSFFVVHLTRAIAQGRAVLQRRVKATNVLFMALEGATGFENRLKAQIELHGETEGFGYIAQPVNLFGDPKAKDDVIEAVRVMQAGILVIDTLNRAMTGGSENDPKDMSQFIANLDAIRLATGAHILVVHHSGKDVTRGLRGHSALEGAVDVSVEVAKDPDSKLRTATVRKAKDDSDGDKFSFTLDVKELGIDSDGDPITTCVVREDEEPPEPILKAAQLRPEERLWLDTLSELFARNLDAPKIVPERGMQPQHCETRDVVREWIKTRGLVGVSHGVSKPGVLSSSERTKFGRMLQQLKIKKKIGIHGDWVWLC